MRSAEDRRLVCVAGWRAERGVVVLAAAVAIVVWRFGDPGWTPASALAEDGAVRHGHLLEDPVLHDDLPVGSGAAVLVHREADLVVPQRARGDELGGSQERSGEEHHSDDDENPAG